MKTIKEKDSLIARVCHESEEKSHEIIQLRNKMNTLESIQNKDKQTILDLNNLIYKITKDNFFLTK